MAIIRRGASPPPLTRSWAGARLSSQGSARATPAPRRNIRRSIDGFIFASSLLFRLEQRALDHLVDRRPGPVALLADAVDDLLHRGPVGEAERRARGVYQQLLRKAARDRVRVGQQEGLELGDVVEGAAVRQLAGRIDRLREPVVGAARRLRRRAARADRAVLGAPAAD